MKSSNNSLSVWDIKDSDFPTNANINDKIRYLLNYAILAPSTFNAQPWLCKIDNNKLSIFINRNNLPIVSDKTGRFAYISIGCFISNFIIAADYYKYKAEINYNNGGQNDLICEIILSNSSNQSSLGLLFNSIRKRSTNRSLSSDKAIDPNYIEEIKNYSNDDISISILNSELKNDLIEISNIGDNKIWNDIDFKKEHVQWVRNNLTKKHDGMPGYGVGIPLIPSFFAKPIILSKVFAKLQSKKNQESLNSTTSFLIIHSNDTIQDWINVGIIYEKIALYCTAKGLALSPMGQFIEVDEARTRLTKILKSKLSPQIFTRIGYPSNDVKKSPRKFVSEILLSNK